jgi:hypothetical protein
MLFQYAQRINNLSDFLRHRLASFNRNTIGRNRVNVNELKSIGNEIFKRKGRYFFYACKKVTIFTPDSSD